MPGIIRQVKADLLFVPHWNVTWSCPIPRVVFIHDLILLEEPLSANITTRGPVVAWLKRMGFRLILKRALYASKQILVPLEFTRMWIKKYFPDLKTPIDVMGEGMPELDQDIWQNPDLDRPYFMTVGSAYPHKNLETLFEAWWDVVQKHPNIRLLVVGKKDAFMQRLMDHVPQTGRDGHPPTRYALRRAGRAQGTVTLDGKDPQEETYNPQPTTYNVNIEFLGEVSDADLKRLYAKALALVFPSRHEGFGLPPLEALAAGCPVLSSDTSCMPEVLGKEGIVYFNPSRSDAIVRAIETVLANPEVARNQARHIVPALKERHDWYTAAKRTLRAFEEVVRVP
jgi:glycosyltransferase involved in cell wall biosynthesis